MRFADGPDQGADQNNGEDPQGSGPPQDQQDPREHDAKTREQVVDRPAQHQKPGASPGKSEAEKRINDP